MKERIKYLNLLEELQLPTEEFVIAGTGLWAVLGIGINGDLDVIISTSVRRDFFSGVESTIHLPSRENKQLSIYSAFSTDGEISFKTKHLVNKYVKMAKVRNEDELIHSHFCRVDGLKFLNVKLIMKMKKQRNKKKDRKHIKAMRKFLKYNSIC